MIELHRNIVNCKNCCLCNNQAALIHNSKDADVFWVGLSAVKTENKYETPLSVTTNSGKLIYKIESLFPFRSFYRTNLVKCLPLDDKCKIRYPSSKEMNSCFINLNLEIDYLKPKLVFLLGKQVATFVLKEYGIKDYVLNDDFEYSTFKIKNIVLVPVHHPSYILVYKRKKIENYISGIQQRIAEIYQISNNDNHNTSQQPDQLLKTIIPQLTVN